jgi:acetoacetyl-CoA synthetase
MGELTAGTLLWEPSAELKATTNLTHYLKWLKSNHKLEFSSYEELWRWSVTELEAFWASMWHYFPIQASQSYSQVLVEPTMPGATWFKGAKLNYAEHVFRNSNEQRPAILFKSETAPLQSMTWMELYQKTAQIAQFLRQLGVKPGDRVVAYVPNTPETVIAFLACASLGAIWSSCSPDFGSTSVLSRFQQIEPKVLIAVDSYTYQGRAYDKSQVVLELQNSLPTLLKTILLTSGRGRPNAASFSQTVLWPQIFEATTSAEPLQFEQVPFDHPLWVLYSSGTTGLPKAIVQGQGGILLEHLKALCLHLEVNSTDTLFWYTSTGWMMWNFLVGGLLRGATIVLYDGSPAYPDLQVLWQLAEEANISHFGASAAYLSACLKAGVTPGRDYNLSRLKVVGSTGSPLAVEGFGWVYDQVKPDLLLASISGGTDVCTAFVGSCPTLPVYAGEIQCACLGCKVEAFDTAGQSITDSVGELVITQPIPSMPLFFWNDPDFRRYLSSYFGVFPEVWRHGDWIKINQRGGCVIYGRSDATINRQGVRMGTAEIYQVVAAIPEVLDSLVVDLEGLPHITTGLGVEAPTLKQASYMPLFVILRAGYTLDEPLKQKIKAGIRQELSPRHVPDEIFEIKQIPTTLSGKKLELPIRKILLGFPVHQAVSLDALSNPESIQFFVDLAPILFK